MNPILSRRKRVRSSSERLAMFCPSMRISPALGRSRPPIKFSSVDLPDPEAPTMDSISPRATCRSICSNAVTCRLPSKVFETLFTEITHPPKTHLVGQPILAAAAFQPARLTEVRRCTLKRSEEHTSELQ